MNINDETLIKVRRLQVREREEIEEILQIQKECNLSVWSANDYRQEIKRSDSCVLAARVGEQIRGFIVARQTNSRGIEFSEVDILNFGVSPAHRNRGIGNALWEMLVREFFEQKVCEVWLEVRESNVNAIKFYKNRGFREVQRRKNFYTHPIENGILMKLVAGDL